MKLKGIYAITDDDLLSGRSLQACIEPALQAGICMLQYRSKTGSTDQRTAQAAQLLELCRRYQTPLIINDDVALCKRLGADGVHLGTEDASLESAREQLGNDAIIGISCHASIKEAITAQSLGADYVAFGRFFPSATKPTAPPAKIEVIKEARATLKIPIVAIGGINAENGAALIVAGADMLAVIHAIFASHDIAENTRRLVELFARSE